MTSIDALERLIEAVRTDVIGFEIDGITVLDAQFRSQPFTGPDGGDQ